MRHRRHSEQGSVILFVMVFILVISIYGIASLKSSSAELMIARNHRCYKQNIYRAEAAIMEIARKLDQDEDPETNLKPVTSVYAWLADGTTENGVFNPEKDEWHWDGDATNSQASALPVFDDEKSGYVVVFEGIAPGASLSMGGSHLWQYGVYGKSKLCDGEVGVVAGFRKRF